MFSRARLLGMKAPRQAKARPASRSPKPMMELLVHFQCDTSKKNTSPEIERPGGARRAECQWVNAPRRGDIRYHGQQRMPSGRAESGIGGNARHRHRGPIPPVSHRHRALITPRAERPKAAQGRDRRRGVLPRRGGARSRDRRDQNAALPRRFVEARSDKTPIISDSRSS